MSDIIHFETLGCKLNQVESEGLASVFNRAGFSVSMKPYSASAPENQDVTLCFVNTCTVTAKAEQKARRIIRLLLAKCPRACVVVTGCYAQNSADEIRAIAGRIAVLGGQYKSLLADLPQFVIQNKNLRGEALASALNEKFIGIHQTFEKGKIAEPFRLVPDSFIHHSRASLKIQDGCDGSCTYCAITLARGKAVSLDAKTAVERMVHLEKSGQSEVVITTVNISQYRSEYDGKEIRFAGLLKLMLSHTKTVRIRISSLYPEIVDEELCEVLKDERVCPHFHLSVQSGSDIILKKMKRPYKIEAVYRACGLLRKAKEAPFLAADIIAGFPGETDDDFEETMKMLSDCNFTFVHAFPFSARPGTEAYKMRPMVLNSVSKDRVSRLEAFSRLSKSRYISKFCGKVLSAVCETVHRPKISAGCAVVHAVTDNFLHCQLRFSKGESVPEPGSMIRVKIVRELEPSERTGESEVFAVLENSRP